MIGIIVKGIEKERAKAEGYQWMTNGIQSYWTKTFSNIDDATKEMKDKKAEKFDVDFGFIVDNFVMDSKMYERQTGKSVKDENLHMIKVKRGMI